MVRVTSLTYQWSLLCGGKTLPDGHQEDGHGEERGDAERHLLPGLRGNVEHEEGWGGGQASMSVSSPMTFDKSIWNHFRFLKISVPFYPCQICGPVFVLLFLTQVKQKLVTTWDFTEVQS